jgi:hypothetical protein
MIVREDLERLCVIINGRPMPLPPQVVPGEWAHKRLLCCKVLVVLCEMCQGTVTRDMVSCEQKEPPL